MQIFSKNRYFYFNRPLFCYFHTLMHFNALVFNELKFNELNES